MVITGLGQVKQHLQQTLHGGCLIEVKPPDHVRDALGGIIHDYRERIASRRIRAREHHIAPAGRIGGYHPFLGHSGFPPEKRLADPGKRLCHVEPERMFFATIQKPLAICRIPVAIKIRIKEGSIRIPGPAGSRPRLFFRGERLHRSAREECRIDKTDCRKLLQGFLIARQVLGLADRWPVRVKAKPGKIFQHLPLEIRRATAPVDILDADQKQPACRPRHIVVQKGGQCMAEMQPPVRARCKAEDGLLTVGAGHAPFCHGSDARRKGDDMPPFAEALDDLARRDETLRPLISRCGPLPERPGLAGFAGLANVVVSQLVSRASATAIWNRLLDQTGPLSAEACLVSLRGEGPRLGLTAAKADTLVRVAEAVVDGRLDLQSLVRMKADAALARLTAIKGIGRWTAEVHLLFNAGHPDIFPAGDLALRAAFAHAFELEERPESPMLAAHALRWSPNRSVAARLFWSYYGQFVRPGPDILP